MTPTIVGIVNLTEDSFSDGGRHLAPDAAIAHARQLVADGADVIDLGPAASHPSARPVPPGEEIRRLAPVVQTLHAEGVTLSVDSPHGDTQRWALSQGVSYLNDIRGFADASMYEVLTSSTARLVVMHQIGEQATRDAVAPAVVLASIERFFDQRLAALERAGIARQRLVVDPGMGLFLGGDPEASLAVLRRLPDLARRWRLPIYVSVSRKSFVGRVTGRALADVGPGTLAAELFAAEHGAAFIRTHDVRQLCDALRMWRALRAPESHSAGDPG